MRKFGFYASILLFGGCAVAPERDVAEPGPRPVFIENAESFVYCVLEDDHGGFYALWSHLLEDHSFNVVGQHVGPDGKALWQLPGTVLESNLMNADAWDAAADGKGGLLFTWIENNRARGQRFGGDGSKIWKERASIATSDNASTTPTLVADAAGGAFIVWSERKTADRWVLMGQHLESSGLAVWPVEGLRISTRPSDQRRPRVVYDGMSGVIVAWKDFRESASQLQAQRLDHQGNRMWGNEGVVVVAPAGSAREWPILTPMGGGGAAFAWIAPSSNVNRFYLQSFDGQGKPRWPSKGVSLSYGSWDEWNPKLVGDGLGNLWAGWEDYRNHTHWQAFVGTLDRNSHSPWPGGEAALGPSMADQGHLALVDDGRKGVFSAWSDNRAGVQGVYLQELDDQGRAMMGEEGKAVALGLTSAAEPQIILTAPGQVAVFYANREKKDHWSLYWRSMAGPIPAEAPARRNPGITPDDGDQGPGSGEGMVP